jgi:hypothetical protein
MRREWSGPVEELLGVFECASRASTARPVEADVCKYRSRWQAPIVDSWMPICPSCFEPAVLVEVTGTRFQAQVFAVNYGSISRDE